MNNKEISSDLADLAEMMASALEAFNNQFDNQDKALDILKGMIDRMEDRINLQDVKLDAYIRLQK